MIQDSLAARSSEPPVTQASARRVAAVVPLVGAWRVDRTFDYILDDDGAAEVGSLVQIPFGHRSVRGVVVSIGAGDSDRELQSIARVIGPAPVAPAPLPELARRIAQRYVASAGATMARLVPPRVRVTLELPEKLHVAARSLRLDAYRGGSELTAAIASRRSGTWCVRVLPNESRAEVISQLIDAAAAAGDGAALVAVPEVHYGSEALEGVTRAHPEATRLDSSRPAGERSAGWFRMASGHSLGCGGRAAVLATADRLRLIVLDDEHNSAYKEDRAPRFDARHVAVERAALQGAVCVLISGTPSVEAGWRAHSGRYGSVTPSRDEERAARPNVELAPHPDDRALSDHLHAAIKRTLRGGDRVALLVPRRGYARALWCSHCRRSLRCPRCEAGMFFDRSPRRVRCPRCTLLAPAPERCPTCGSAEFRYVGAGSERLAEQLAMAFPRNSVARVDPDVIDSLDGVQNADIYVTTWIGTKAAIRPDAKLVGVLDADALIRRSDFRSAENAYHALAAMAEWAGPAADGGRLVIQSAEHGHHSIQAVTRADYEFFLEREVEQRRELGYPPFSELIKVSATGEGSRRAIEHVAGAVRAAGATVLGPINPGGLQSALEILIKATDARPVCDALRDILARSSSTARLRVDVDPR